MTGLDLNQTLQPAQQQSWWLYIGIGTIFGAVLTGILNIIRDGLNRKRDREDNKNKLIGELKGQKILTLQYYAFYFFSFISREYLSCRSGIQSAYEIDYKHIYSIPEPDRNKEIMRVANEARTKSIEYASYLKEEEELKKWKLELAKSNKHLFTIIGSLQNYYSGNSSFNELSKQIELAMDTYARLEQTVMDKFGSINQETQEIIGKIPKEALEEENKIAATSGKTQFDILPRILKLQDDYYYKNVECSEASWKRLKKTHQSVSKNLEDKINALTDLPQKGPWWRFWK